MGNQDYRDFHKRRGHKTEDYRDARAFLAIARIGAVMPSSGRNNNSNNRCIGKTDREKARRSAYRAKKRDKAAATSTTATTTKAKQASMIPATNMGSQTVGGGADNNISMGGLGGGGGGGAEEVPPSEGDPALPDANLRALLHAALAEVERLKAKKGREPPQGEKGQ